MKTYLPKTEMSALGPPVQRLAETWGAGSIDRVVRQFRQDTAQAQNNSVQAMFLDEDEEEEELG